jgi:hypothetical protein
VEALLEELRAWSCSPLQQDRLQHVQRLAASSWAGVRSELLRLLGFCRKHGGVPEPTLHHCLNQSLLLKCISFLHATGVAPISWLMLCMECREW